jgi:ABC-type amino acid transport substrate-binding protein
MLRVKPQGFRDVVTWIDLKGKRVRAQQSTNDKFQLEVLVAETFLQDGHKKLGHPKVRIRGTS